MQNKRQGSGGGQARVGRGTQNTPPFFALEQPTHFEEAIICIAVI